MIVVIAVGQSEIDRRPDRTDFEPADVNQATRPAGWWRGSKELKHPGRAEDICDPMRARDDLDFCLDQRLQRCARCRPGWSGRDHAGSLRRIRRAASSLAAGRGGACPDESAWRDGPFTRSRTIAPDARRRRSPIRRQARQKGWPGRRIVSGIFVSSMMFVPVLRGAALQQAADLSPQIGGTGRALRRTGKSAAPTAARPAITQRSCSREASGDGSMPARRQAG